MKINYDKVVQDERIDKENGYNIKVKKDMHIVFKEQYHKVMAQSMPMHKASNDSIRKPVIKPPQHPQTKNQSSMNTINSKHTVQTVTSTKTIHKKTVSYPKPNIANLSNLNNSLYDEKAKDKANKTVSKTETIASCDSTKKRGKVNYGASFELKLQQGMRIDTGDERTYRRNSKRCVIF